MFYIIQCLEINGEIRLRNENEKRIPQEEDYRKIEEKSEWERIFKQ